jgi:hypothetical protein
MEDLRMKCPYCGYWNNVPVNKIFIEQPTSEPKVKAYIPMYEPLEVVKCKKCGKSDLLTYGQRKIKEAVEQNHVKWDTSRRRQK